MLVMCFGDSNTYGFDPRGFFGGRYSAPDRWVDLLADRTGFTLINAGVNGRTVPRTPDSPGVFPEADIFLVMLGTNDLLQGASAQETAARMTLFLEFLRPRYKQILLVSPPPMQRGAWVPTDRLAAESVCLAEEYRLVAQKMGIPFVDTRSWNISLAYDGVHFTEEGHHSFAENMEKELFT